MDRKPFRAQMITIVLFAIFLGLMAMVVWAVNWPSTIAGDIDLTLPVVVAPIVTQTSNFQPNAELIGSQPAEPLIGTPMVLSSESIPIEFDQGELGVTIITDPTQIVQQAIDWATEFPNLTQSAEDPDNLAWGFRITPGLDPEWQRLLDTRQNTTNLYGVLQFEVPFDPARSIKVMELYELGVIMASFYEHRTNTQLAVIPPQALPIIAEWVRIGKLRYAGPIPVSIRVSDKVWEVATTNPQDPLPVYVWFFEMPVDGQAGMPYLYPNYVIYRDEPPNSYLGGWIDPIDLQSLASMPQIRAISYRTVEESCLTVGFDKYCGIEPTPSR